MGKIAGCTRKTTKRNNRLMTKEREEKWILHEVPKMSEK
jgi:hypothetical protein